MSARRLPDLGPHGEGWVAIQLVLFGVVAAAGSLGPQWHGTARFACAVVAAAAFVAGGLLSVRGVLDLRQNLTAFPRPKSGATLVETGSYRLVRHPIYGGLLFVAAAWGLLTASVPALAATVLLGCFFDLKARREEGWLAEQFDGYAVYRARTHKLLPWLY